MRHPSLHLSKSISRLPPRSTPCPFTARNFQAIEFLPIEYLHQYRITEFAIHGWEVTRTGQTTAGGSAVYSVIKILYVFWVLCINVCMCAIYIVLAPNIICCACATLADKRSFCLVRLPFALSLNSIGFTNRCALCLHELQRYSVCCAARM